MSDSKKQTKNQGALLKKQKRRFKMVTKKVQNKNQEIECNDPRCPYHGNISIRGKTIEGIVVSAKMDKTIKVRKERIVYIPKYKRYKKSFTVYTAHNPKCIDAKEGDLVRISETRPLSKTKTFVVLEVLNTKTNQKNNESKN